MTGLHRRWMADSYSRDRTAWVYYLVRRHGAHRVLSELKWFNKTDLDEVVSVMEGN